MTSQDSEEQITLSSSAFDQFKDDDKPTTVTREMSQAVRIKEHLKLFRIFDKKFININEKTADGITSYFFRLSMLDPTPVRKRIIKFKPLIAGFVLLALSWLTYYFKNTGHPLLESLYIYTVIVALAALGLILIVYVIKEFRNVLIFYSQHGRIPVIELLYRIPNKVEFQQFVTELVECINIAKSRTTYSDSQLLAAELSEHRKVRDEGGLSGREYEIAKNNIMKFH
jgi:hypothetical protein